MKLIFLTKPFVKESVGQLIDHAHTLGIEGFDLCVRPGYVVSPENAGQALPQLMAEFKKENLCVPMVTSPTDLVDPSQPAAKPLLSAMDKAGIRLLKIGYFRFTPGQTDFWTEADRIRKLFSGWQELGKQYKVKICYHTHSGNMMGCSAGSIMHLLSGFDPQALGAYLDTTHLLKDGEPFEMALSIAKKYLSIVGLKDPRPTFTENGDQGKLEWTETDAGKGAVDWTAVFSALARARYDGPMTINMDYGKPGAPEWMQSAIHNVDYYKKKIVDSLIR